MGRERREAMKSLGHEAQAGCSDGTGTSCLCSVMSHPGLFPSQHVVAKCFWDPEKHNFAHA